MGALKLAGGIRVERISSESESEVQPIYQPPVEIGGSVAQGGTDHKWWTRPVTLRSLLNAIEVFYY